MPHGHGRSGRGGEKQYCHCPVCDYVTIVEEGEQCSLLRCPKCGRRLYQTSGEVSLPLVRRRVTRRGFNG